MLTTHHGFLSRIVVPLDFGCYSEFSARNANDFDIKIYQTIIRRGGIDRYGLVIPFPLQKNEIDDFGF